MFWYKHRHVIIKKEVEKLNYLLLYNHNTQVIIVDWSSYFGPNGRLACRCHDDKLTILKKTLSQKVTCLFMSRWYNASLISCNEATKSMHTCMLGRVSASILLRANIRKRLIQFQHCTCLAIIGHAWKLYRVDIQNSRLMG